MGLVKCLRMKNRALVTSFGRFQFNENGVADIPDEHEDKITALKGYESVDGEAPKTDEIEKKEEKVEVTSTEEEKVEIEEVEDVEEDAKEEVEEEEVKETVEEEVKEEVKFTKKQLQDKTINDLKKLAGELGIDVSKADKKAEFVDIIFDAQ